MLAPTVKDGLLRILPVITRLSRCAGASRAPHKGCRRSINLIAKPEAHLLSCDVAEGHRAEWRDICARRAHVEIAIAQVDQDIARHIVREARIARPGEIDVAR